MKCDLRPLFFLLLASILSSPVVARADDAALHSALKPAKRTGWHLERHEKMNERVAQGDADLLMIGDSITQAWESGGKKVWDQYYGDRKAVNLGISGDRTQHVLWRLDNGNIKGLDPKLAVIMIGTNNSGSNTPEEIADGTTAIVKRLRTKLPKMKVLILGVFPRGTNDADPRRQVNMKANAIVAKLADDQMVHYLDISQQFLTADRTLSKSIMPDLLHLTPAGYRIWAESIEPAVAELLGGKSKLPATVVAAPQIPRHRKWWDERQAKLNGYVKDGKARLLFIGDSITQGWEGAGKQVWPEFYSKRNAVNLGIGGDRTQHVSWRLDNGNLKGIDPKLAVIMIGTNNSGSNTSEEIAAGVESIVRKLQVRVPECKILLLATFPRGANSDDRLRQVNAKSNEIIAKLDDGKTVFYLDIGKNFLQDDGTLTKEIMPDLLHLSPQGYKIWAESIESQVAKLLEE